MLKIDPNQTFEATASINLNGLKATFGIIAKLLHNDRLKDLRKQWMGEAPVYANPDTDPAAGIAPTTPAVASTLNDRQFIDAWLVGFAPDVMDAQGQPLAFTPESVTMLLNTPGAKLAVIEAFFKGYEEAETKNSVLPRVGS